MCSYWLPAGPSYVVEMIEQVNILVVLDLMYVGIYQQKTEAVGWPIGLGACSCHFEESR